MGGFNGLFLPLCEHPRPPNLCIGLDGSGRELRVAIWFADCEGKSMTIITPNLQDLSKGQRFRGAIDGMNEGWVYGWIIDTRSLLSSVEVKIFLYDEHVLTGLCNIFRDDIAALIGQPVPAGFSVPLADIEGASAQRVMARLKADGVGTIEIREILRVEVDGMVVAFSPNVGTIDRETLFNALNAQPGQGQESRTEGRYRRDSLLDSAIAGPESPRVVAFYTSRQGRSPIDWTTVASALPRFEGHNQPRLPGELGFYDLRVAQVHREQAALARSYGVSAFCYEVHSTDDADSGMQAAAQHAKQNFDLDFCYCWVVPDAEGGTGGYQREIDAIAAFLPGFRSPRYLTIRGTPLLLVDGVHRLRHPSATIEHWRKKLNAEGFAGLHVSMVEHPGYDTPAELGCDSSCDDPRRSEENPNCPVLNAKLAGLRPDHSGTVHAYADIVCREMARPAAPHLQFRTALPGWDETPCAGAAANIFAGATPELFQVWMTHLVTEAHRQQSEVAQLVFVRGWNDWTSGAYLEPDHEHERGFLRALRAALGPDVAARAALAPPPAGAPDPLAEARRFVESLMAANKVLSELLTRSPVGLHDRECTYFVAISADLMRVERLSGQHFSIESLNGLPPVPGAELPVASWQGLAVSGWFLINGASAPVAMLSLRSLSTDGRRYIASIPARQARSEVAATLQLGARAHDCGFRLRASLHGVAPGRYEIELLVPSPFEANLALAISTDHCVLVGLAQ